MSVFPISVTITSAGLTLKEKSKGGLFTKVSPGGIHTYSAWGRKRGPRLLEEGPKEGRSKLLFTHSVTHVNPHSNPVQIPSHSHLSTQSTGKENRPSSRESIHKERFMLARSKNTGVCKFIQLQPFPPCTPSNMATYFHCLTNELGKVACHCFCLVAGRLLSA